MSDLSKVFTEGCKVVISPDKMRAWITLVRPRGSAYTAAAVTEWLPQNGVVYGADAQLIRNAVSSGRYDELLEVARGKTPVSATGADYTLQIDKKPFTGLNGGSDGSLFYDDLSFLQEVQAGQTLAEIVPAVPAEDGMTVTGEVVAAREGSAGRTLEGSGFEVSQDGKRVVSPQLAHVNIVNNQLVVTPVKKLNGAGENDGDINFDGNILIEGDVTQNSSITATGSVFITGRAVSCSINAGNNVLISRGFRGDSGFGKIQAKGNVWGLFFESCNITAGGDICANHLTGCEVTAGGRAAILGGRGAIISCTLNVTNGVVAAILGDPSGASCAVSCGLAREIIDKYAELGKRIDRLGVDIQAAQQNITAFERLNRMKPDKGKSDPQYKEMVQKRDQGLSVLKILNDERTRARRVVEQASAISIIARETAYPGVTVSIDTRSFNVLKPLKRVRFRRAGEEIEYTTSGQ